MQAASMISKLVKSGCAEFCCVGVQAEELQDAIDAIVEDLQRYEVVTTADTDETEACEYFLFAAGGGRGGLLALVNAHPELVETMNRLLLRP